ncbi:DUF2147 domain-containing protein [Sedimentitalea nanhaiensis]|uniref:Uncharacterized conserved protein, DUF2147 family n=1 Tax=Sedimentitalea nanhaiensis TaxID=999627 RepID=A0A1I7B1J0_9RHOB|nr:DUF2147 domain-containing protein [Sedimentitalea nanhaiensis]SFT81049.1 Uncharacterized conserved protein, DUF2147 family [Sedimentitalea nanhaiensis]
MRRIGKKIVLGAVVALGLAGGAMADPVEGTWQTEVDDGAYAHVAMAPCGGAFCGTMVRTFNSGGEYKSPNIGKKLILDMVPQGDGTYKGKAWRPSNGKTYIGKMTLKGDTLYPAGCVLGGLLCFDQTWTRIK